MTALFMELLRLVLLAISLFLTIELVSVWTLAVGRGTYMLPERSLVVSTIFFWSAFIFMMGWLAP